MRLTVAAAVVAGCLLTPALSGAATIEFQVDDQRADMTYRGGDGETNAVTLTGTPTSVTVSDPGATTLTSVPSSSPGCTIAPGGKAVTCATTGAVRIAKVEAQLSGSPADAPQSATDQLTGFSTTASFLQAPVALSTSSPGTLTGGPAGNGLTAEGGAALSGGGGDDVASTDGSFDGGPGDDMAFLGGDTGSFAGGDGEDTVVGSPARFVKGDVPQPGTFRLDAAAPTTGNGFTGQSLTLSGVEDVIAGPGNDTIIGSAAPNVLIGLGGADTIEGGAGSDLLYGGAGPDYISQELLAFNAADDGNVLRAVDGETDRVTCGSGSGTIVTADTGDALLGCPAVGAGTTLTPPKVVGPPQVIGIPGPDTTKATVGGFKAARTVKGNALRKTGRYSVTFTPNEPVRGSVALVATARGVARIAKAGDLQLATKAVSAAAGKKTTVKLTVSKTLRKLLRKGRRFRVVVTLVDRGGNTTTVRRVVRVRG